MSPSYISVALRQRVVEAAQFRCGYCLTSQRIIGPLLEIDHIIPVAHGGTADEENLWLAWLCTKSAVCTKTRDSAQKVRRVM
jgi:5-methylcytosine-specific restriction endonuclease McrA